MAPRNLPARSVANDPAPPLPVEAAPPRAPRAPLPDEGSPPPTVAPGDLLAIQDPAPSTSRSEQRAASPRSGGTGSGFIVGPRYDLFFFLLPPVLALLVGAAISGTTLSEGEFEFLGEDFSWASLFIGVFGYKNASFSIVGIQRSDARTRLADGQPQRVELGRQEWAYFSFSVSDTARSFELTIDAESGDPDVYVSADGTTPTTASHGWSSATAGGDELVVSPATARGQGVQRGRRPRPAALNREAWREARRAPRRPLIRLRGSAPRHSHAGRGAPGAPPRPW